MFKNPDVLWLNSNPYLLRFNLPVMKCLSNHVKIGQWEYKIHQDESTSINQAIELLDDYLNLIKKPVHLIGHSTCGLLGLYYAQKYPEKVKSLTVLGVGANAGWDWVSYYYIMRSNLQCSHEIILAKVVKNLFGYHNQYYQKAFIQLLEKALLYSLSPHSLYQRFNLPVTQIHSPLMICGSKNDKVVSWNEIEKWQPYLKEEDYLWQCPQGEHFFHYFEPKLLSEEIVNFWHLLSKKETPMKSYSLQ